MIRIKPYNDASIAEAVDLWRGGHLVAFGTETVYGLGADARNGKAVAAIFKTKNRPQFNPLICHVADGGAAFALGVETPLARVLADAFWAGAMTLILARRADADIADLTTAGLDSIAVRVPSHKGARGLLAVASMPIAAPSANPSGGLSPTTAAHVSAGFAGGDEPRLIIDMGTCQGGLESTIIDARGDTPIILRPGAITAEMIADATNLTPKIISGSISDQTDIIAPNIIAPGQLARHYAPRAKLRLNADAPRAGEAWLGFGTTLDSEHNLSPQGDLLEAASNLFAMLRELDASGVDAIAVAPIPFEGVGVAINDRLSRAAAAKNDGEDNNDAT